MRKVFMKSKLGRPYWCFGQQLSPDSFAEFEVLSDTDPLGKKPPGERVGKVTIAEVENVKQQCMLSVRDGGTMEIAFDKLPESFETALGDVHSKLATAESQCAALEATVDTLKNELAERDERIKALVESLSDGEAKVADLESKLGSAAAELDKAKSKTSKRK